MKGKQTYTVRHLGSAVFMILALLWLTVSTPFVNACQQELTKQHKMADTDNSFDGTEEESSNACSNTTEEKKPSGGNSMSEEYLHDHHSADDFISTISRIHTTENAGIYTAFHGEVQVPPPNRA